MERIELGRTGLLVSRVGFGAIPIQRISFDEAKAILQKAYHNGINFYDTARNYSDSEEKIGYALAHCRKDIIIATKTKAIDKDCILKDIHTSLNMLKTDYIDLYQIHNPANIPDIDDSDRVYQTLLDLKARGIIRYIGITTHRLDKAIQALNSGYFDTIQYPLNTLSTLQELQLIGECKNVNIGVIGMKALSGGLITNAAAAYAFMSQYQNLAPIWGIQKEEELDEFISFEQNPPKLDTHLKQIIEKDRLDLSGDFCRGCGYCMPCSVGIPILTAARMSLLLRRQPHKQFLNKEWKEKMQKIEECIECEKCMSKCPYNLDIPKLLKKMLQDYRVYDAAHKPKA